MQTQPSSDIREKLDERDEMLREALRQPGVREVMEVYSAASSIYEQAHAGFTLPTSGFSVTVSNRSCE